ncbi:hypothetical protein ACQP2K_23800 [Microbispora siamensis]
MRARVTAAGEAGVSRLVEPLESGDLRLTRGAVLLLSRNVVLPRRGGAVLALGRGCARGVTLAGPAPTGPLLAGPALAGSGVTRLLIAGAGVGAVSTPSNGTLGYIGIDLCVWLGLAGVVGALGVAGGAVVGVFSLAGVGGFGVAGVVGGGVGREGFGVHQDQEFGGDLLLQQRDERIRVTHP